MPAGMLPAPIVQGNIDTTKRVKPLVHNPDGSYSTLLSVSFQDDKGREVLVPRVVQVGGAWKVVSERQAWQHYLQTGQHLGIFRNAHDADIYGTWLHNTLAQQYEQIQRRKKAVTKAVKGK